MRIIQTLEDFKCLKESGIYAPGFLDYLYNLFLEIFDALAGPDEILKEFSLKEHGPLYILEKGDNLLDLSAIGLNRESKGLLGTFPESVELIRTGNKAWYRIDIVMNNEFAVILLVEKNDGWGSDIKNWLERELFEENPC